MAVTAALIAATTDQTQAITVGLAAVVAGLVGLGIVVRAVVTTPTKAETGTTTTPPPPRDTTKAVRRRPVRATETRYPTRVATTDRATATVTEMDIRTDKEATMANPQEAQAQQQANQAGQPQPNPNDPNAQPQGTTPNAPAMGAANPNDPARGGMFPDFSGMQAEMRQDFQQLIDLLTQIRDILQAQSGGGAGPAPAPAPGGTP